MFTNTNTQTHRHKTNVSKHTHVCIHTHTCMHKCREQMFCILQTTSKRIRQNTTLKIWPGVLPPHFHIRVSLPQTYFPYRSQASTRNLGTPRENGPKACRTPYQTTPSKCEKCSSRLNEGYRSIRR